MAKAVLLPIARGRTKPQGRKEGGCVWTMDGDLISFNCQGCKVMSDPPTEECLDGFKIALEANHHARGILLHGDDDVWVREGGLEVLRSLLATDKAFSYFRASIASLPCHRHLPKERIDRYIAKAMTGSSDLFCTGESAKCETCLERQRRAIDALAVDRRRARRSMAVGRFRITMVQGGRSH